MRWTRRRRLLALTTGAAFLAAAGIGWFLWRSSSRTDTYTPGQAIAGITSELRRSIPTDYDPGVTFTDVTAQAGIRFRHFGGTRSVQLPEDMGSGVAWGDYDNDGLPDLFLVNVIGPLTMDSAERTRSSARSKLYRNRGDGTFEDVTAAVGIDRPLWGMGAAWADYDNDGWLDLVVTAYGEIALFKNQGGRFSDVTARAGMEGLAGFWAGASWGDADRDGDLDLYVTGYVRYQPSSAAEAFTSQYDVAVPPALNPSTFPPERNLFFRNDGNGSFTEMAAAAGIAGAQGRSLSASWTDVDDDGWPDLYVANDVSDNVLYRNRGNGTFEDVSHAARVADYRGAMGIGVGDWDNDGDTDLFISHWIAQENALYTNLRTELAQRPRPPSNLLQFADEADRLGLGQSALDFVGWGTFFFDYDNDGRQDLFVANGHTLQAGDPPRLIPMTDQLFWNGGMERGFFDVSAVAGAYFETSHVGRGAAFADYDGDGDLDVAVVNHGGPAVLLRNDGARDRHWLVVRLEGRRSNRSAIGAKVRIVTAGRAQLREIGAQSSYLSQNWLPAHFGLGDAQRVDTVRITWPRGIVQVLTDVSARRVLRIVEPEGR